MNAPTADRRDELQVADASYVDDILKSPRGIRLDPSGRLPGVFEAWRSCPDVAIHLARAGAQLRFGGNLRDDVRELAVLVVAAHWQCWTEFDAHSALAESSGLSTALISQLRSNDPSPLLEGDLLAAYKLCRWILDPRERTASLLDGARRHFGGVEYTELALVVAYYSAIGMTSPLLDGSHDEPGARDSA